MKKEKLVLIGGGGHCKSVIDVIEEQDKYIIAGIVDLKEKLGTSVSGYKVIATDNDLENLSKEYKYFFISVGQIKTNSLRVSSFNKLKNLGVSLPAITSPKAYVSKRAIVGEGSIVMHYAVVNAGAIIGNNCIVNTASIIEHDTCVSNHCHISTGVIINGDCYIGTNSFVGSNTVINHSIKIGENCIIGSGTVVISDTKESSLYVGNPAKIKRV
jgi:sugar O-acyltransferase (sialic acid O-acetyltransferase NeuD family)